MSHSASRIAGGNRAYVPVAPTALPLPPSPSQTALPSIVFRRGLFRLGLNAAEPPPLASLRLT